MPHPYKIREATSEDKKPVLALLNKVYSGQQRFNLVRDEKFWHWKYESNVFGKPIIHVIENNYEIVGSGALWPWKFITRGEVFHVYQPCDTTVHPAHQGKGLFSLLNTYRIPLIRDLNTPFVYNFPNKNSLPGYLKIGWHYVTKLPWMIKVLNPLRSFHSKFSKDKSTPISLNPEDKTYRQSCELVADESVYYKKYISTYRESGFFDWRYNQHPYFDYGQVIVELGRKKAGAIFSINHKGISREMAVVDIFGDTVLLSKLFDQIKVKAKAYNVDYIVVLYNKYYKFNELWKKGYILVKDKNMVVLPFDIRIEQEIIKYKNWNPIAAMHDSI